MNRWHQLERIIKFYKINSYVELGTWRLRNFGYLYQACPKLKMTGVDLYRPQPNLKVCATVPEKAVFLCPLLKI